MILTGNLEVASRFRSNFIDLPSELTVRLWMLDGHVETRGALLEALEVLSCEVESLKKHEVEFKYTDQKSDGTTKCLECTPYDVTYRVVRKIVLVVLDGSVVVQIEPVTAVDRLSVVDNGAVGLTMR